MENSYMTISINKLVLRRFLIVVALLLVNFASYKVGYRKGKMDMYHFIERVLQDALGGGSQEAPAQRQKSPTDGEPGVFM